MTEPEIDHSLVLHLLHDLGRRQADTVAKMTVRDSEEEALAVVDVGVLPRVEGV